MSNWGGVVGVHSVFDLKATDSTRSAVLQHSLCFNRAADVRAESVHSNPQLQ